MLALAASMLGMGAARFRRLLTLTGRRTSHFNVLRNNTAQIAAIAIVHRRIRKRLAKMNAHHSPSQRSNRDAPFRMPLLASWHEYGEVLASLPPHCAPGHRWTIVRRPVRQ